MNHLNRREFIKQAGLVTGSLILFPAAASSSSKGYTSDKCEIVRITPPGWDPITYNRNRGNAGAIPKSYIDDINSPDGDTKHIGKHLPYIPEIDPSIILKGYVPLMWGDPEKGHFPHPNAGTDGSSDSGGHWFNRIRIRKSARWCVKTSETVFSGWPETKPEDSGSYAVFNRGEITDKNGIKTIYMAILPPDIGPGDTIRIQADCLQHGQYIDFITL